MSNKASRCRCWLNHYLRLNGGCANVEEVRIAAKSEGFNRADVKTARKELDVTTYHRFDWRGEDTGEYYWFLPGKEPDFHD